MIKESQEQIAFVTWLNKYLSKSNIIHFSIPNERKANVQHQAIMNKMGRLKGIPDYFIAYPNNDYAGLFIEFKSSQGKLRKEQENIHKKLIISGYKVVTCYSAKEASEEVKQYFQKKE